MICQVIAKATLTWPLPVGNNVLKMLDFNLDIIAKKKPC